MIGAGCGLTTRSPPSAEKSEARRYLPRMQLEPARAAYDVRIALSEASRFLERLGLVDHQSSCPVRKRTTGEDPAFGILVEKEVEVLRSQGLVLLRVFQIKDGREILHQSSLTRSWIVGNPAPRSFPRMLPRLDYTARSIVGKNFAGRRAFDWLA